MSHGRTNRSQVNGHKMPDDDEVCVLCMSAGAPASVAGSTERQCDDCGVAIWVSPATLASVAKFPKKRFLCIVCAEKRAKDDPDPPEIMPPNELQIDELRQALDKLAEDEDEESP